MNITFNVIYGDGYKMLICPDGKIIVIVCSYREGVGIWDFGERLISDVRPVFVSSPYLFEVQS